MIYINKNPNGDTRTAPLGITKEQFREANVSHIYDVQRVMYVLAKQLENQGARHDHTKLEYEDEFFDNFCDAMYKGKDFVSNTWYQKHITEEKHHPLSKCHDDITLLDVIETIVDCVCAGKARSGKIIPIEIDKQTLDLAVQNTIKWLNENVTAV